MREFTLGPLSESWSAQGGRQLVGQAANLTFESTGLCLSSPVRCYRPNFRDLSPCIITQPFTVARRVEGWVDLDNVVSMQPVPKAAYSSNFREKRRNLSAARFNLGQSIF